MLRAPASFFLLPVLTERECVLFDPFLADFVHRTVVERIVAKAFAQIPLVFFDLNDLCLDRLFHLLAGDGWPIILFHAPASPIKWCPHRTRRCNADRHSNAWTKIIYKSKPNTRLMIRSKAAASRFGRNDLPGASGPASCQRLRHMPPLSIHKCNIPDSDFQPLRRPLGRNGAPDIDAKAAVA